MGHSISFKSAQIILLIVTYFVEGDIGQAYILKIPLGDLYKFIPQHGDYTHRTFLRLGKIAENNLKNRNCEFSLRPNPNVKKVQNITNYGYVLLQYEVENVPGNF